MLEYVASPQEGGEYYVPLQFREALIAWVRWKDIISVPAKGSFPQRKCSHEGKIFLCRKKKGDSKMEAN